ncbi:MAG: HAMP domain-containing histidine kinase, partial [Bacteroidaceae bacterium]|nr:HAMP domain-containing histidine kinase [Bacteroidaceae bacterium]
VMGGHDGLDYHGIPADMQSASILGIHPDDREKGVAFFKKICEDTSRPHRTILRVMSRVLQQYRYFQMVLLPMMRLDGQFGYYAGFCIDVTEQFNEIIEQKSRFKTRIASLEEEKRRSEVSQKKMEDLLSSMGHDLRSPLNAILGFSEIMASNCNTEETRECYKYVKLATEQMTMIINDILEMTRIDSGRIKFNISRFTLSDLLENIYQLHRLQYSARTCELVLDDRIEEDVTFTTDEQRVIEILNNFLSNAAKYTKQGTVTISSERKDNGVCIHVRDTGVGIQPEDCEKIFNRFETLGAKEQGYGLGLYICRKLAHGLGGEVGCQSEVGKGSDFWLWLPLD